MPHAARSPAGSPLLSAALPRRSIGGLGPLLAGLLAACPAPAPSSGTVTLEAGPRGAEPAGPEPALRSPSVEPAPTPLVQADPTPTLAPDSGGASLPPALAADGVRPVVRSLWQALDAVGSGDPDAMARAMTPDGRWFPPGRVEESVQGSDALRRAMAPWGSPELELDVRRIIVPDGEGPFVAQVSVASRKDLAARHEVVLRVEPGGDRIAAVHHFGHPLGPVRAYPREQEPLDLGPVGEVALVGGASEPARAEAIAKLMAAIDERKDDAARALLAEDAVLHDVTAGRTRQGRDGYVAGMRETLGETGHLAIDRRLAGGSFVVVEGAIFGRDAEAQPGAPQEHGFADVHRMVDGTIAETWRYVNRRGRPHRSDRPPG
jgi:ketosteroid isomerase-like protein